MQTSFRVTRLLVLFLASSLVWACNKSSGGTPAKPPMPVFYANVQGTSYIGLSNYAINFSAKGLFVLQSDATFDTTAAAISTHPAFQFSIYAPLAAGTYTFQPPGPSANGGIYSPGVPGVDYSFQPDPYQPGQTVGGTLTISKYDSGRISGSFAGGTENTDLNVNDELLISGSFSNIPVVIRQN